MPMDVVVLSKDSGKTTSPEGTWETQMISAHRNPVLDGQLWLALYLVTKHEAWKVSSPPAPTLPLPAMLDTCLWCSCY